MGILLDAVKKFFKRKGQDLPITDIYKKSSAPAILVPVGLGKEYDNKIAIRKGKSQRKNWKRWRKRF